LSFGHAAEHISDRWGRTADLTQGNLALESVKDVVPRIDARTRDWQDRKDRRQAAQPVALLKHMTEEIDEAKQQLVSPVRWKRRATLREAA
jgi:hypothetical protein